MQETQGQSAQPTLEDRRSFLAKFASGVFAGMVLSGKAVASSTQAAGATPTLPGTIPGGPVSPKLGHADVLLRMQQELIAAQKRQTAKWIMVIDTRKCVGCHACSVACAVENHLPPGFFYRPVDEVQVGEFPKVTWKFLPRPCNQCDNPPCVPVCPADATWKAKDGIVDIDYDKCIGCEACVDACPYGSRHMDEGNFWTEGTPGRGEMPYETMPSFEYGKQWTRQDDGNPVGTARKCHFCRHRISEGLLPQCVTTCIGRATFFGDANDPNSLVSELIKGKTMRLKEELGTKPSVYYLT